MWYELIVGALVLHSKQGIAGEVQSDPQVREDVQRAYPGLVGIVPDRVRSPPAPARPLAIEINQLVVVVEDVVCDAIDRRAQRRLLVVVGHEVVVHRVDEIVADDFVRAGVPFPAPACLRRVMPLAIARLQRLLRL